LPKAFFSLDWYWTTSRSAALVQMISLCYRQTDAGIPRPSTERLS
jgi:hypothetical protein